MNLLAQVVRAFEHLVRFVEIPFETTKTILHGYLCDVSPISPNIGQIQHQMPQMNEGFKWCHKLTGFVLCGHTNVAVSVQDVDEGAVHCLLV